MGPFRSSWHAGCGGRRRFASGDEWTDAVLAGFGPLFTKGIGMVGKKQISKVGRDCERDDAVCGARGERGDRAGPGGTHAAPPLPNCAVTTASVGTMEVTEFFGLPATGTDFAQSFGLMPKQASTRKQPMAMAPAGRPTARRHGYDGPCGYSRDDRERQR